MSVLTRTSRGVAYLTLDRPAALCSLNLEMVRELYSKLDQFKYDDNIKAVVLNSSSQKAFCAGGDVKSLVLELRKKNFEYARDFFQFEYAVDYAVHRFPKPIVAIAHGITMGGGIGLAQGACVRIGTESTLLAMPEIAIGLFADVGVSHNLSRLPSNLGLFAALTGARFNGFDGIILNWIDRVMDSQSLQSFYNELELLPNPNREQILAIATSHTLKTNAQHPSKLTEPALIELQRLFAEVESDFRVFEAALKKGATSKFEWIAASCESALKGAPTSVAITLLQFKYARQLSLKEVFMQDYRLALHSCEKQNFLEGVRALLIDKDATPRWAPATMTEVDLTEVSWYFSPLSDEPLAHLFRD